MPSHKIDRSVGKQVGGVLAAEVYELSVAPHVIRAVVQVLVVVNVARHVTEKFVEPAIGWPRTLGATDIPFAKRTAHITELREVLRNDLFFARQTLAADILLNA